MVSFKGGPLDGRVLALERAPDYLRGVCELDLFGKVSKVDALDQLEDEPADTEQIHVYRRVGSTSRTHVCFRGRDRGKSGWKATATYVHLPDVIGEKMRDAVAWRAWAETDPVPEGEAPG